MDISPHNLEILRLMDALISEYERTQSVPLEEFLTRLGYYARLLLSSPDFAAQLKNLKGNG